MVRLQLSHHSTIDLVVHGQANLLTWRASPCAPRLASSSIHRSSGNCPAGWRFKTISKAFVNALDGIDADACGNASANVIRTCRTMAQPLGNAIHLRSLLTSYRFDYRYTAPSSQRGVNCDRKPPARPKNDPGRYINKIRRNQSQVAMRHKTITVHSSTPLTKIEINAKTSHAE